jgi:superfamily I DNA/RNA helicase
MDTWWRELRDLDEDQRAVIGLAADGSYLVRGPPGSGKTNLLLLRANYLANTEHSNLAIVVFNRTLCEFIRSGGGRYEFDRQNVLTSHQFFHRLLAESGTQFQATGNFYEDRKARLKAVADAIPSNVNPIYDVLLLDEAQDYLEGEVKLFRRLARDVFMVADSRQQIYSSSNVGSVLEGVVDRTLLLRFHYRSGLPICEVADKIGSTFTQGYEPIAPTCNYNSPDLKPSVEIFQGDLTAQALEIARRLSIQRRTYPESLLGVICPRISEVTAIGAILSAEGLAEELCMQHGKDGYQPINADRPIWVSTVHSAKGLEFRALHFAASEFVKNFRGEQKRLAYTGVTRAKTSLVVYHDGPLPRYFDAAMNVARPRNTRKPDIGAAFGRR